MRSWSTRRWRKGSPRFSARCPPGPDAVCRYLLTPDPNPRDPMIQKKVVHRTIKARDLIPALADRYRVLAPDYPGFGYNSMPPRDEFAYWPSRNQGFGRLGGRRS